MNVDAANMRCLTLKSQGTSMVDMCQCSCHVHVPPSSSLAFLARQYLVPSESPSPSLFTSSPLQPKRLIRSPLLFALVPSLPCYSSFKHPPYLSYLGIQPCLTTMYHTTLLEPLSALPFLLPPSPFPAPSPPPRRPPPPLASTTLLPPDCGR